MTVGHAAGAGKSQNQKSAIKNQKYPGFSV
jgi:hypothetical protein